jgi:hypothetical protein
MLSSLRSSVSAVIKEWLFPPPFPETAEPVSHWSRRQWFGVVAVSVAMIMLFGYLSTLPQFDVGADFKRCYTWMVTEPWRLPLNAERPWTLNPLWLNFFMAPFVTMPWPWGYITFMTLSAAMVAWGAYWFGGKPIPLLLSAHVFWVFWWGQIEGWAVLGLVLAWVAAHRRSWRLMTLALALAAFKPQVSLLPVAVLWWWSGPGKWKSAGVMAAVTAFTVVVWGPWPWWYWQGLGGFVGDGHANILRASIGPVAWPLVLFALLAPLNRTQRLLALTATVQLASPYLPYYSTLILLCFNVPWWAYLFGVLGYLTPLVGTSIAWNGITFLPITILLWLYAPWARRGWEKIKGSQ